MAVPTYAESTNRILDEIQANVSTNAPFSAAEILRYYNDGYQTVWELGGGRLKKVASASAWTTSPTSGTTGVSAGILTDIAEVLDLFYSTTSGSVGETAGDRPLKRVEREKILFHRESGTAFGTYAVPKLYSITELSTAVQADVNKVQADVWPGVSGIYLPMHYRPQFVPHSGTAGDVPDLTDLLARDLELIVAAAMAPKNGRAEFVPSIVSRVSDRTRQALERKASAGQEAGQDRA